MNRKISKISWIVLAALLCLSLVIVPGCTTPDEPEPPGPGISAYIGSGLIDGEGIPADFFSDLDVRKGFCYAFDYDTYIADALQGQGVQRGAPVTDGLYGYDPATPMYSYNLALAEEHLKAAWDGEVWDKGFKFTLLYNAGNLPRKTACEILQENLFNINPLFVVSIAPIAWPTFLGKIWGTRDMPMFQIGWAPDYPHADNFIVPFMHSHGTFSGFQGYGDAALDNQIAAAFQDTNPTTQQDKYDALQQRYYDDAPGIVLAQPIARRYFTQHISGFYHNPCESAYAGRVLDLSKSDQGGAVPYKNDGIFVFETIGDIDSLDPAWIYDTSSSMQVGMVYEQLLYYDGGSSDTFQPLLATAWSFNESDLTLRFTIREGVQFHEGGDLTPEDVEYTFERAMCQDRPGGPIWMYYQPLLGTDVWGYEDTTFAAIDAAVEVDGDDVVFTLAGDYWAFPFLQVLSGQWACIVDKEWCIAQGDWDGTEGGVAAVLHPENPGDTVLFDLTNGTGPWKLNTWDSAIQIILDKNTNYWDGAVPFTTVITKMVEEWSSRKLSLLAGDADLVYVPATNFDEMDLEVGLNVYEDLPSLNIDAFFFNMIIGGPSE